MSKKYFFFYLAIFILAIISRFAFISIIPTTIQRDESAYIINAISAFYTGENITRDWTPFSLTPVHPDYSELTSTLMIPFFILKNHQFAAKMPFILIGLISPLLIAVITQKLTKSKSTALFAYFIANFNPYIWQMSRLSFDSSFSFFFYLLGVTTYLCLPKYHKLWSLIPFIIGFYQYQGYKVLILPLVCCLFIYDFYPTLSKIISQIYHRKPEIIKTLTKNISQYLPSLIIIFIITFLSSFYFFVQLPQQNNANRASSILTPSHTEIITLTDSQRHQTLTSSFGNIFINRYAIWGKDILNKYFQIYNPSALFSATGEVPMFYIVNYYGIMHLADLIICLFGLYYLAKSKKYRLQIFLLFILILAPIPAVLSDNNWFFYRASFRIIPLIIIASCGANYFLQKYPKTFKFIFTPLYLIGLIFFTFLYFFRLPMTIGTDPHYGDLPMSNYISRNNSHIKIYTDYAVNTFDNYLIYQHKIDKNNISQIQDEHQKAADYNLENLIFTSNCINSTEITDTLETTIISTRIGNCDENQPLPKEILDNAGMNYSIIRNPADEGENYYIINDKLCSQFNLSFFSPPRNFKTLNIKKLDDQDFCQNYINKSLNQID